MKKRLDLRMVESQLVSSRTKAQDLIRSGAVWFFENANWVRAQAPNQMIKPGSQIEIRDDRLSKYVSRGGLKLERALVKTSLRVSGMTVLDVGMSTGGFTDCLLKHGAGKVVGVDVGRDQLHPNLKSNPQVIAIEGVNARELERVPELHPHTPSGGWPLIVVDVSFISLTLILPSLEKILAAGGCILALVKPQFEVGPEGLGKGGLVKDPSLYQDIEKKILQKCLELNLRARDYFSSSIEGKDGNKEFFIFAQKN
jgi:23S rRNA (cytidine1920-2'-O)/16S rRNA (cytidine1409-2'-O)-methyltransferase